MNEDEKQTFLTKMKNQELEPGHIFSEDELKAVKEEVDTLMDRVAKMFGYTREEFDAKLEAMKKIPEMEDLVSRITHRESL